MRILELSVEPYIDIRWVRSTHRATNDFSERYLDVEVRETCIGLYE
jgi:hypothetical protein